MDIEFVDININTRGELKAPKHNRKLYVDADTLAFAACIVCEEGTAKLDEDGNVVEEYTIDLDRALDHVKSSIQNILDATGGKEENIELYFTKGKQSFRYHLLKMHFPDREDMQYKYKRVKKRPPVGLGEVKSKLHEMYPGKYSSDVEADDWVVHKKKQDPDSILVAVDKDVIGNVAGKHFNYYVNPFMGIREMVGWVETEGVMAVYNQYKQVLTGDRSDAVPGLAGIGEARAQKILQLCKTEEEYKKAIMQAYLERCDYGDPLLMCQLNMQLVNMHQFNGEKVKLWTLHDIRPATEYDLAIPGMPAAIWQHLVCRGIPEDHEVWSKLKELGLDYKVLHFTS